MHFHASKGRIFLPSLVHTHTSIWATGDELLVEHDVRALSVHIDREPLESARKGWVGLDTSHARGMVQWYSEAKIRTHTDDWLCLDPPSPKPSFFCCLLLLRLLLLMMKKLSAKSRAKVNRAGCCDEPGVRPQQVALLAVSVARTSCTMCERINNVEGRSAAQQQQQAPETIKRRGGNNAVATSQIG